MVQEIITYLIIATAVWLTVWKIYMKFWGTKKHKVKTQSDYQKATYSPKHNCSDCIAECSLRDALPDLRVADEELCESTVVKVTES